MKIFIGCTEICGLINVYANELRQQGHTVTTYTESKNKYFPEERYDITGLYWADYLAGKSTDHPLGKSQGLKNRIAFSTKLRLPVFDKIISERIFDQHDVFIFLWAGTYLMRNGKDLAMLRQKGKKIISILVGSDVRYPWAFDQEFGCKVKWSSPHHVKPYSHYTKVLRDVEMYSDVILSVPDQMGLAIRPYDHFQIPLNLEKYTFNVSEREVPIVTHAPSNSAIKGTAQILEIFERLKKNGVAFETRFIENMPNQKLVSFLSDTDILVDELILHGPGVLSFEAMASGCAVATCYYQQSPSVFRPPVCSITTDNLYSVVKRLIVDKPYRRMLAFDGRKYVEENNAVSKVVKDILSKLEDKSESYDYKPSFFRDKFVLPEGEIVHRRDKEKTMAVARRWMPEFENSRYGLAKKGLL